MKDKIIPIVSVVIGVIAILLSYNYLRAQRRALDKLAEDLRRDAQVVRVMAAAHDIPSGTAIQSDDLGTTSVPRNKVGGRAVLPDSAKLLLGRKTLFTIKAKDPILWSDIEGGSSGELGLATLVKKGMRAISLSVGGAAAVSGMVRPNDRIDVLGTFSFPSKTVPGEMETVTLTVLQDVTVLATGQTLAAQQQESGSTSSRRSTGYSTVTLEVTPREAEMLVFAQQMKGRLTLALRNPSDVTFEDDLPEINFDRLESTLPELNLYRQRHIRGKRTSY